MSEKPPFTYKSLEFLKPIADWYSSGLTQRQIEDFPPRVINALDSIKAIFEREQL